MQIIVSRETVSNHTAAFEIRRIPRKYLGRGFALRPRPALRNPLFWRVLFEQSLPRYIIALFPFPVAAMVWPHLALPISQAPLLMFGVVYLIEVQFLTVSTPEKRKAMIDPVAAARGLDQLRVRARKILTQIAAGRPEIDRPLHLIVETSGLIRVAPLTIISVQVETEGRPEILDLTAEERGLIETTLFDDEEFTEDLLRTINISQNAHVRDESLDPGAVSAHARLFAMARASGT